MTPRIAAVATAVPPYRYTQAQILALAGYADERRRGFFTASDIEGRHLWIDPARFTPNETVDELNARFCEGALVLAESAARATLARAGWTPEDLDFIATTTCTGRLTPSLDAHLVARLGCRAEVQRVHVGDTGCASAMVALQQAWNHLQAFPRHRALVTAVEICSAAYFLDDRLESAVAHAIFADGAGALARDHRAPHGVQLRAPSRDGLRVSGWPAARRALQGGPTHRGLDDGSDGARAHGDAGPQARRHRALGAALCGAPRAGPRARPARPHRCPDGPRTRGPARARQYVLGDHPLRPRATAAPRASRARRLGTHD